MTNAGLWKAEHGALAAIHGRLRDHLSDVGIPHDVAQRFELHSFRQGGRNCLQIVVATPPPDFARRSVFADIDIDLGYPLWDLEGLFVHLGELFDSGKTDHLKLRRALAKTPASEFLYYDLVKADETFA